MTSTYAIRGGKAGARRLDLLAQVMGPTTEALLDAAGVGPAMVAVDAEVATEIGRSFDYFRTTSSYDDIARVVLSGGCAKILTCCQRANPSGANRLETKGMSNTASTTALTNVSRL